jgi:hypothetical protein
MDESRSLASTTNLYTDLKGCKKHFKKIARDFCYPESVIKEIDEANSEFEVQQIMVNQRTK